MEPQSKRTTRAGADPRKADAHMEHAKPKLDPEAQIDHLKRKGVGFNITSEAEAMLYLADKNTFFKLISYRKLFPLRDGGARDGEYANLEFAYLQDLASVDQHMRYAFLPMTLDIEHFAKVKVVSRVGSNAGEDGYSIVADYLSHLTPAERKRRERELGMARFDPCSSDLVEKYCDDMPVWVLLELVSFGTLIDFYLFCSQRWGDQAMAEEHYLLRQVKALRNSAAHSSNMLVGLREKSTPLATSKTVSAAVARTSLGKRARSAKMRNPRLQQMATFLWAYNRFVVGDTCWENAKESMAKLKGKIGEHSEYYEKNDTIRSSFDFLEKLLDAWF
ncbi:Abi family protein [Raoultibacter phocaeensis]|uniref:Abi family protein n=1 Tax=Raoultibacter phocaeensis TaxID=2479841 RepID=UPI00111B639D|nr:Abi family protein [Raoultibacter phocaeensis]